ncbi:terminase large subunit domain-containing protein [Mycoplana ramosa]|uniref:Terminase large subunit domain-containing protein n=1 Tax=Mycoplana ramosa TaxID=40837 RepID=A0ABW3YSB0_MYCRA
MSTKEEEFQQLAALRDAWYVDIPLFAKQVFDYDLTPKQVEFCEAFRTSQQITFKGGVGFGKTFVMSVCIWWALITHDQVKISVFGPSEPNLKTGVWNELKQFHDRMLPLFRDAYSVQATTISRVVNAASCTAEMRLADKTNTARARGIHAENNFVFVDEASGVDDEVFTEALVNILSDGDGAKLCLISNPDRASGFFWRTWNDPEIADEWTKVHGTFFDSRKYDPSQPEKFERIAKNFGGPTSRQYRIMVEGEFPLSDTEGMISREFIDAAVRNYADVAPAPNVPILWGLDPAGAGKDSSVLCIRHDNKILDFKQWQNLDPTQLAYKVRDLYEATPKQDRPAVISVDSNGLGNGVWSNLKDWGLPVHGCNTAKTPTRNPDRYSRLRDQLLWEVREWIHSENVGIPNSARLIEELATPTYEDSTGKIKVEDKKSIKKRLGRSPDFADALALTFAVSPSRYASKYSWSKPLNYDHLPSFE